MGALTLMPLDLTGNKISNRVNSELHNLITVINKPHRLLVPYFGAFYEDLFVLSRAGNQVLVKNVDYKLGCFHKELSLLTGRAVYGMVIVINPSVPTQVYATYRAVGGGFGLSTEELSAVLTQLQDENISVDWDLVINKPRAYPVEEHTHQYWQLYGADKTVAAMARIEEAIGTNRDNVYNHDIAYAETQYQEAYAYQADYRALINAHRLRIDNPHNTTKAQVDLGNVENLQIASTPEAQAGTRHDRYMTPLSTYYAGLALAEVPILNHASNTSNPHNTTAAQVGGYTRSQIDTLVSGKVGRNATVTNSARLDGRSFTDVFNIVKNNLDTSNFTDMLHTDHLSIWPASPTAILYEQVWREPSEVFGPILPPIKRWVFIGEIYYGTVYYQGVRDYFNATFTDLDLYPYGTIILYIHRYANQRNYGNGVHVHRYVQLEAAVRTASGWIQYS